MKRFADLGVHRLIVGGRLRTEAEVLTTVRTIGEVAAATGAS
jgi:hypothetical protein